MGITAFPGKKFPLLLLELGKRAWRPDPRSTVNFGFTPSGSCPVHLRKAEIALHGLWGFCLIRLVGAVTLLCLVVAPAIAAPAVSSSLFALDNITAIDGSTLSLQRVSGGVLRTISSGGVDRRTIFRLLHDGLGTVSEIDGAEHMAGLFLLSENSISTEYTDGRSETLSLDDAGGAALMLKSPDGAVSCTRWYGAGHRFTVAERKAQLAAYARRLGIQDPRYAAGKDDCPAAKKGDQGQPVAVQGKAAGADTGRLSAITAQLLALYVRKQSAVLYGSSGFSDGFENFYVNFLAAHEGGYAADDGNGSPANFGINQGANPDVDVANLTQSDAKQLLHDRYWVPSGADRLPPELAAIHGDTAINMGVRAANELLALSDGDPGRYLQLRDAKYRSIAEANPDKAGYLPIWLARNRDLRIFGGLGDAREQPDDDLPAL